ncbi:YaaR family protein [Desulfosporosinus nitroreducens]|uniref:YaaR family protein n=1 Tax=Desulfosporosinus nitroreducens TaxID=2018668 RepID=UPI00207CA031|nr:YaaR family protein [Desulfosporosinus nitroreducens]MCO1601344.1 YaaR family protein [Desulfosporosinus nitroreducens]
MSIRINSPHQTLTPNLDSQSSLERNSDFSGILTQTQKIQSVELQTFLERLGVQGKKLAQSLSIGDLKDFRDMVKSFLRSTFGQSRKMQEDTSWDYQGRPKVMARIGKIDEALDELGKQLLDEQAKPLEILTKIDEIRGLIVDLFA